MFDLTATQDALLEFQFDGWLLYDFRGTNPLARRIVDLEHGGISTRRWFYLVPPVGVPRKLVHTIESAVLDHLPGEQHTYLTWQELEAGVAWLLNSVEDVAKPRVAMEYAPGLSNPYISRVDAGTIEFVRSLGVEVVSSGDLVQMFEARWDDDQWTMHQQAAVLTRQAYDVAWGFIAEQVRAVGQTTELAVQRVILDFFAANKLVCDNPPIVGVGPHSGDPHYEPTTEHNAVIREGDFVLIDLWAKLDQPRAVYSDLTQVGYVGRIVPERFEQIFQIVAAARDAAIERVRSAFANHEDIRGWQVDAACRAIIDQAGYGQYFIHRTGHNIGQEDHGNGAHMDNLETHDERQVLRRTCFSIEPGIYLPEFGIRSEVNVYIDGDGQVHVTGGTPQERVLAVMKE